MEALEGSDYRAILQFVSELYVPAGIQEFPDRVLENIRRLIPCDFATYDEMDPARRNSIDRASPAECFPPEIQQSWEHVMHEHPVLIHCQSTGDLHAYRISDFYSRPQYHSLALYQEYYRKVDIEDVLCIGLHVSGPIVIGCGLHRIAPNFTPRDCHILDLVGQHMTQAWRNASALSRLQERINAVDRAAEALDAGVVTLGPGGEARLVTPPARALLNEFFADGSKGDHRLPDLVVRWLGEHKKQFTPGTIPDPLTPLVIERPQGRLLVRLLIGSEGDLLLLQAVREISDAACGHLMGLTPREAEILGWVAKGKTNREIGIILGASPRTVKKHLEHVFIKLGVETRTAAAAALKAAHAGAGGSVALS